MEKLNRKYGLEHGSIPDRVFDYPVRVAQFGTGVLLRGLVDLIFQQAVDRGLYQGRIAMIKSTSPDTGPFREQDNIIRSWSPDLMPSKTLWSQAI